MQYGQVLSNAVLQRDSLLFLRKQTISLLEKEIIFVKEEKDSLIRRIEKNNTELFLEKEKNKKLRKHKTYLSIAIIIISIFLFI